MLDVFERDLRRAAKHRLRAIAIGYFEPTAHWQFHTDVSDCFVSTVLARVVNFCLRSFCFSRSYCSMTLPWAWYYAVPTAFH